MSWPLRSRATQWCAPHATFVTLRPHSRAIATGFGSAVTASPWPSSPCVAEPQVYTAPPWVTHALIVAPASACTTCMWASESTHHGTMMCGGVSFAASGMPSW